MKVWIGSGYRSVALLVLCVLGVASPRIAGADKSFDHARTSFPLTGRHQKVACESCHPAAGSTRKWAGVPTDCHGCHGDRANHKGTLGAQCERCHQVGGWKLVKHSPAQHRFALVGKHDLKCVSCHAAGAHLAPDQVCRDCHAQPHSGTSAPCLTCHNLVDFQTVTYTKHTFSPASLPGKHAAAKCIGCHPGFGFAGTTVQCASCHRKDQPHEQLAACDSCHVGRGLSWKPVTLRRATPTQPPSIYQVGSSFDHVTHAQKVTARGLQPKCGACHAALNFTQRPSMQSCESCHDGQTLGQKDQKNRVFDALGTQCVRCHKAPAVLPTLTTSSPAPFSHEAHAKRQVTVDDCRMCHGAGVEWQKVRAGRDQHRPCQKCHAAEFRKSGQPICLVCHLRADPFAPNPLRPPLAVGAEWRRGDVPHSAHAAAELPCQTCHLAEAGLAPSSGSSIGGHAVCGRCHIAGTPLTLERCSACHTLASAPRQARPDRPWSTRARFRHDQPHREQPCESCHRGVAPAAPGATAMAAWPLMNLPTMGDCASCHNGSKAFKVTGFECARCHTRDR